MAATGFPRLIAHSSRIGRVLIARGRDAADVPISNAFGPSILQRFKVRTDEVVEV